MRILQEYELEKVAPFLRDSVLKAWKQNEIVPYAVTLLTEPSKITEEDIEWARKIIKSRKVNDL